MTIFDDSRTPRRIAITGYPGVGKTTLSNALARPGRPVFHTDDYLALPRETRPYRILELLEGLHDYVLEGTEVARLFRRGYKPDRLVVVSHDVEYLAKHGGLRSLVDRGIREAQDQGVIVTWVPRGAKVPW